ncbi:expressed unknown protein [Seminavis robusta]|uniref:Transmembrane protein n=1 Tax=Seminavis robusta TaxID=568900 RepID=A0A9N8HKW5_9STRA|nr:expressed unknown protein [Seminavis robusta]|eukprot:Sro979_g227200.1 n/a (316) ;mRNA; r:6279-7226
MFALSSSLGESFSSRMDQSTKVQRASNEKTSTTECFTAASSYSDDDSASTSTTSIYHDTFMEDLTEEDDAQSCGGTILDSLSSKVVRQNVSASARLAAVLCRQQEQTNNSGRGRPQLHVLSGAKIPLSELATVPSDALSFTPTMAEVAMSGLKETKRTHSTRKEKQSSHYHPDENTVSESGTAFGIQNVQPERVACPFCYRERDLEWKLSKEKKQSQDFVASANQTRVILVATVVCFAMAFGAFFLGKAVSDRQAEKAMAQYVTQCETMVAVLSQKAQKEEDELYWRLVSAAFTAMVNAAAGPVANFVIGGGNNK